MNFSDLTIFDYICFAFWGAVGYLALDVFSWFMWALSGQAPVTDAYLGAITGKIIGLFF